MSTVPARDRFVGALHLVRPRGATHALVSIALAVLAVVSVGFTPSLITALWMALVTHDLVLTDVRVKRLPNALVVPGLLMVLLDGCWSVATTSEFPTPALLTTLSVAVVMVALNLVGGLGMGDVKLSAVIAGCLSLISPAWAVSALMLAFFIGGAYSAVLLIRERGQRGRRIAFGPVLLAAFWIALPVHALSTTWVVSVS